MSVSAFEFLQLAESLNNIEELTEMDIRTSASRAYYAIYHAILPISRQCLPLSSQTRGGVHAKTIRQLENGNPELFKEMNRDVVSLAIRIKNIKHIRTRADYNLSANFRKEETTRCLDEAKHTLNKITEINLLLKK